MSDKADTDALKQRLEDLKTQHRDLDEAILALERDTVADPLQIQRLKKRKLQLKDTIARIESRLRPDIIA